MSMTIVSWNVNGMRSVMKWGFMDWLKQSRADVVCVQEARVHPEQLSAAELEPDGYTSFWMPGKRKGYSGVGVYTRHQPISVVSMGRSEYDDEGRVQLIEFPEFTIINSYWPNSQPERKRIQYKLSYCQAMRRLCNKLVKAGRNVIVCGDLNIAHTEIDLARPKQNEQNPGYLPEERAEMTRFIKAGYVDTFRHYCKDPGHYSWWSVRTNAREKNIGWRLDYHLVNHAFMPRVSAAAIHSDIHGSDHCPVSVTIQ